MAEATKFPPFGGGSLDFDKLHAADAAGKNLDEALKDARHVKAPASPAAKTPAAPKTNAVAATPKP